MPPKLTCFKRRSRQAGYAIVSTLFALAITAMLTRAQIQASHIKTQTDAGRVEAQVANLVSEAVNAYVMENYPALQSGLAVTKNGVTLPSGNAAGQSLSPTVPNLVAMGYLPQGTSELSLYVPGGTYQIRLRREPASCTGVACNIPGLVYIDRAVVAHGTTQINAPMIGAFVTQIGGSAMFSTNVNAATLTGPTAATVANPLGATPGVVGVAAGFGAAGFGRFLVIGDPRDPNFQGNVTVQGKIESRTSVNVTNPSDTCDLASMWVNTSGVSEFLTRSAACVQRSWVRGDGTVGVADATGVRRADMHGNNGNITSYGADGVTPRAGFTYNGSNQSEAYADNLRNSAPTGSANSAGIAIDGRVYGRLGQFNSVVLNTTASINASCTQPGEMVWGTLNGNPLLMKCEGGRYVPTDGTAIASGGASCSPQGATAKTIGGVHLICEGGIWKTTIQRIGRVQMDDSVLATTGTNISKPTCAAGGTPHVMLLPRILNAASGVLNYSAVDMGGYWTVQIIDNDGALSYSSQALAHTYCAY